MFNKNESYRQVTAAAAAALGSRPVRRGIRAVKQHSLHGGGGGGRVNAINTSSVRPPARRRVTTTLFSLVQQS